MSRYEPEVFTVEDTFEGLVSVARTMLDRWYPDDIMGMWPDDPGPQFTMGLRELLDDLEARVPRIEAVARMGEGPGEQLVVEGTDEGPVAGVDRDDFLAGDEIEIARLEEEVSRLSALTDSLEAERDVAEVERLMFHGRAEDAETRVGVLEEALREIASIEPRDDYTDGPGQLLPALEIARAAL